MKSEFTEKAYQTTLWIVVIILQLWIYLSKNNAAEESFIEFVFPVLIIFSIYWAYIFYKTRMLKLCLNDEVLQVSAFFGLGKDVTYKLMDLDGYKISGRGSSQKLSIVEKGRNIATLHDKYYSNFDSLHEQIAQQLKPIFNKQNNINT